MPGSQEMHPIAYRPDAWLGEPGTSNAIRYKLTEIEALRRPEPSRGLGYAWVGLALESGSNEAQWGSLFHYSPRVGVALRAEPKVAANRTQIWVSASASGLDVDKPRVNNPVAPTVPSVLLSGV